MMAIAMLACQTLAPAAHGPAAATALPLATSVAEPTSRTEATAFAPRQDFTLIRVYAKDGDLHSLLAAEVKKAQARGQVPFVEFDAGWCSSCQAITASLAAGNELTLNAYRGVYLIHADVDEWGWDNSGAGFPVVKAIPIFFALNGNDAPGAVIDGGAWGADIPENFAPVLTRFFHP
jgi:thiol-disulfide isomerase/thioredoxin